MSGISWDSLLFPLPPRALPDVLRVLRLVDVSLALPFLREALRKLQIEAADATIRNVLCKIASAAPHAELKHVQSMCCDEPTVLLSEARQSCPECRARLRQED
ncbi:unnamed protein product [Effrenium voratum]|uniref:Uncharacterized protein n=1 Tax=Effrenium voratum TaxID=2562239 RepID=A0AA36J476_9DINO|nr:unnamed protein product [Effrenium voratum]CAJ1446519.1 unnamed protein product [Effrenium voratum]